VVLKGSWLKTTAFFSSSVSPANERKRRERTRTADLLITSELLKSRESDPRCFSLLFSQYSIRRNALEAQLSRVVSQ
jgi:hypothetical protein